MLKQFEGTLKKIFLVGTKSHEGTFYHIGQYKTLEHFRENPNKYIFIGIGALTTRTRRIKIATSILPNISEYTSFEKL